MEVGIIRKSACCRLCRARHKRHDFASRLVMAGVDLRTVQELMGHKTIQMTVRYAHLAPKHQLAAVQRLCDTGTKQKAPNDTKTDTGSLAPTASETTIK